MTYASATPPMSHRLRNRSRARILALAATVLWPIAAAEAFELPKIGVPSLFGGKEGAPPPPGATPDCPEVFLEPGAAMMRAPADAESANVRYQLSINSTARECIIDGDKLTIKVGVEGSAVLGAAGQPGAYGANLRIAFRRQKDDSIVSEKVYRVAAAIPAGGTRDEFRIIADPVTVPVMSPKAQEDYEILVGFTQGGGAEKPAASKKRKR